jgi:cyclopropane-fatty-acyl-phospholipid synthase
MMEKLTRGQLRVLACDGTMYTFGSPAIYSDAFPNPNREVRAEIRVVNDAFWVRMLLLSDLGFSEAFMVGDIEVDDLDALFKVSSLVAR